MALDAMAVAGWTALGASSAGATGFEAEAAEKNPTGRDAPPSTESSMSPAPSVPVPAAADASAVATPAAAGAPTVTVRSVLAFEPMSVAFDGIEYTVQLQRHLGGGQRTLLHGISGFARPGRMLALMGASGAGASDDGGGEWRMTALMGVPGAGKTTLLDVLAGRKNSGVMAGRVFLNGHPKDPASFNRGSAAVLCCTRSSSVLNPSPAPLPVLQALPRTASSRIS